MEQNSYNIEYEIILVLLRSENHVRNIAKQANSNHMTVSRALRRLTEKNIIDYKPEGKNKVYFLKKDSTEMRLAVFSAEHYKLVKILSRYPRINIVVSAIQRISDIKLALLFGSYTKGTAKTDSDIDVYVETTSNDLKGSLEKLDSKLSIKIGRYNPKSLLMKEIKKHHAIIKGVERYYEKENIFEEA